MLVSREKNIISTYTVYHIKEAAFSDVNICLKEYIARRNNNK